MIYFTKSARGYSHKKEDTVCQDHSSSYFDENRVIITACDGHGSSIYFRSDRGSKFASFAIINALKDIEKSNYKLLTNSEFLDKIKLQILCEWNESVEKDLSSHPFTQEELQKLSNEQKFTLKTNPETAYGTTLNAVMVTSRYVLCVKLGDGGVFYIKDQQAFPVFEDDSDNVANITCSICQDKAFNHLCVGVLSKKNIDGAIICTDGLLTPYQSLSNFQASFVKPMLKKFKKGDASKEIKKFINKLADKLGVGDDVSLGVILKETRKKRKKIIRK